MTADGHDPITPAELSELSMAEVQSQLPALLDQLEAASARKRVTAAWSLCLIGEQHPEVATELGQAVDRRESDAAMLVANWLRQRDLVSTKETLPGKGTDSDWEQTDPRTGDSGTTTDLPADEVIVDDRFAVEQGQTSVTVESVLDHIRTDAYARTYSGLATSGSERHAVLIRTYVPPATVPLGEFRTACMTAFDQWTRVDDHDHVLTVYDRGDRPHPWAVLGYGTETLVDVGRLPPRDALRIGFQLASAMGHAHERGIAHLTIDPTRVLIDRRHTQPDARLLGFGMQRVVRMLPDVVPVDPRFAAPEYVDTQYGSRDWMTDIYQLGGVLYALLTGRPPFADSKTQLADRTLRQPSAVVDGLPETVDRIIRKAMTDEKLTRYESVDELGRDIKQVLGTLHQQE